MISISCAGKKFINFLILRSMVKNNFAPGQRDGVLGSTLTCKYLSSEAFLRKSVESGPPQVDLLSSLMAKKPSKWLKMHFYGHKGDKIFILQPLR